MKSRLIEELRAKLPLKVDEVEFNQYVLNISGSGWRLRVSGPWRLLRDEAIFTSSGAELRPDMVGRVKVLVGESLQSIDFQSRLASLDIAVGLSNEMILEIFSENIYDDWLLVMGDTVVEGPMHQ